MTQPNEVVTRKDQLTFSGVVFREFIAKLSGMEFPVENGQPKTHIQFVDMKIIRTIAPYPHPAAEIVMNRANKAGKTSDLSPWGRLIISSDDQGYPDIVELIGKELHMNASEKIIEADPERGREAGSFIVWEILSVDGVDNRIHNEDGPPAEAIADESVPNPKAPGGEVNEADLLTLIDGKTIGEFTAAALALPLPAHLRAGLLDANDLIPKWISSGKVTTDGNTYTVV